jgi:hypothetical protein
MSDEGTWMGEDLLGLARDGDREAFRARSRRGGVMAGHWRGSHFPWLDLLYGNGPATETEHQRTREADKQRLAEMAPLWREQQRQRREQQRQEAEAAFQQWRAERHKRAERPFAELHAEEDEGFPPPAVHFRK